MGRPDNWVGAQGRAREMASYKLLEKAIEDRPRLPGVTLAEIADLPEALRDSLLKALQSGALSVDGLAGDLELRLEQAVHLAALLADRGFLQATGEDAAGSPMYRINLARRKGRDMPNQIWDSLLGPLDKKEN